MASEGTPSKPKKQRTTTQKKDERKKLIDTFEKTVNEKRYEDLSQIAEYILKLGPTVDEAKSILSFGVDQGVIQKIQVLDKRQSVIYFLGYLNHKIKKYDVALNFLLKLGEVHPQALEKILEILEKEYEAVAKNNKELKDFLIRNNNSTQSGIAHLLALCEIKKVSLRPKKSNFFVKSPVDQKVFDDFIKYLHVLKKTPERFYKVVSLSEELKSNFELGQAVLSVFDEPDVDSIDSLLGFLKIVTGEALYEKPPLLEKLITVIENFIQYDKDKMLNEHLATLYEKNGQLEEAQQIRKKDESNIDIEESSLQSTYEKEDEGVVYEQKDVDFQKKTVAGLREKALEKDEESMQTLLGYSQDQSYVALPEVWEALGEIYVKIGKYKKGSKSPFEYAKKDVPRKCFDYARTVYEKCYKAKLPRPGIYYDLGIKYREGGLFRKNLFLSRRLLEEGLAKNDLSTEGLVLLASLYFKGEGGIEKYEEARDILTALYEKNKIDDHAEALYLLGECEYLFYLDYRVDGSDKAEAQKKLAEGLFKKSSQLGHSGATRCLRLFTEAEPMELSEPEEELRDELATGSEIQRDYSTEETLTELCNELRAHKNNMDHPSVAEVMTRLIALDPSYKNCTANNLAEKLRQLESERGTYFEKDISDDSDSDRDQEYHGNDNAITAKKRDANKLIDKIRKQTQECLTKLEKTKEEKLKENYKKLASEFKSKYTPVLKTIEVNKNPSSEARRDLETVVDYAARGKLDEALSQISTPFYVVQTRGLHFFVDKWSREQRHVFKRQIYDKNHPLLNQPVYSASAHVLAQVKDRFPQDDLSKLKLRQAARCLSYRLAKLKNQKPHDNLPEKFKNDSVAIRKYKNRLMQVQQLYSAKYDDFLEEYLAWEIKQAPHFFANQEMHFVSTADIQSKHGAEYAIGNKYYLSKEKMRLRPRYNRDLRATKPHMGAEFLTIHPLEDYLPGRHNHIPSLNIQGEIELKEEIVAERECTFLGSIPAGRLSHVEAVRFPSFHHERYLEVMRHRYGLDKELYERFRNCLKESKPHSDKNRLTILLLGEHIAAYKTLSMQKRADDLVRERGTAEYLRKQSQDQDIPEAMKEEGSDRPYLLYRTPLGNFSFFSDQPFAATPNGGDVFARLRRFQTAALRKAACSSGNYSDEESSGQEVKKEKTSGRVTTLGDGNCAFNAVTLGVCELLEQELLPSNFIFEAELSAKLEIEDTSREALIDAIKKVKGDEERQLRFQPLIRKIAIKYIEDNYDAYCEGYHERLIQAFNNFNDPGKKEEDQIFCVHDFICEKFSEEGLSAEVLIVWWEDKGKQQYFDQLRESARNTMDRARWGSEIEIDAFGKVLSIKISWQSSRMDKPKMIGAFDEDESVAPAFGVYFSGEHWTYVRLSQPETTMNPEDEKDGHDEVIRSESDYEEQRKSSQRGLNF